MDFVILIRPYYLWYISVESELSELDQAVLKQAHYGLATFLLEAAKHDRDADSIG